jgi:hypothetical protein
VNRHGLSLPSGALNGAHDARICAAAADVAVHVGDYLFARRLLVRRNQRCRLHDLSGLAVAELWHLLRDPRLLQWMLRVRREALDGGDLLADHFRHGDLTRAHRFAVDVNCAGAAKTGATTELGAGELQLLAHHPK